MKPGGFVAGVSKGGRASHGTRSCLARSSVLYLLRRTATEGACDGAAQGPFGEPGQAGFAGRTAENARACEKQSPPGRQRLRALGWSEAEEKRSQPGRRRYIKSSRPSLKNSRPPSLVFSFLSKRFVSENAKMRYCSKATIAVFGKLGFSGSRK